MADYVQTATSVLLSSGSPRLYTAGEALTAGQPVYFKDADDKVWRADNNVNLESATVLGIALNSCGANQPVAVASQKGDVLNLGATLAKGDIIVLSANVGALAPVADLASGNYISVIGVATSTSLATLLLENTGVQK